MSTESSHQPKVSPASTLRNMTAEDVTDLLESLSQEEARATAQVFRLRLSPRGMPETAGEAAREKLLLFAGRGWPAQFAEMISERPSIRAREILQDSYDDPSREELDHLTEVLMSEFGVARTQLFFSRLISVGITAEPLIRDICAEHPDLSVVLKTNMNLSETATLESPLVTRRDRTEARQAKRAAKKKQRDSNQRSRENNRRFKRAEPVVAVAPKEAEDSASPRNPVIESPFLVFPHLGRYPNADVSHMLVGSIVASWIRFTDRSDNGKVRPCVILAVEPSRLIVKPLYSEPRRGAGDWRAVEIMKWREAGLAKKSWAGDEIHRIRRLDSIIGRLDVSDWNRICRGEVNNQS